jgi:hypothetical protein
MLDNSTNLVEMQTPESYLSKLYLSRRGSFALSLRYSLEPDLNEEAFEPDRRQCANHNASMESYLSHCFDYFLIRLRSRLQAAPDRWARRRQRENRTALRIAALA